MISKRLSSISSSEKNFNEAKHDYEMALQNSGYSDNISFQKTEPTDNANSNNKRTRKRNIVWFNPPYSTNVSTNIGARFLSLIDKHFTKKHPLHKIVNRNTIKISYSCMPNVGTILKGHNKAVLSKKNDESDERCNCRNKEECPLNGKCLTKSVVYKAEASTATGQSFTYIGLTENEFKTRYYGHTQSFRDEKYRLSTELSKIIWDLNDKKVEHCIDWKIITKSRSYKPGSRFCNLCLTEKLHIIKNPDSINKRSELLSKCRHARKFLVRYCN